MLLSKKQILYQGEVDKDGERESGRFREGEENEKKGRTGPGIGQE